MFTSRASGLRGLEAEVRDSTAGCVMGGDHGPHFLLGGELDAVAGEGRGVIENPLTTLKGSVVGRIGFRQRDEARNVLPYKPVVVVADVVVGGWILFGVSGDEFFSVGVEVGDEFCEVGMSVGASEGGGGHDEERGDGA